MEKDLLILKDKVIARKKAWEDAKDPAHATSIFVCNRRIQKLNDALKLLAELELIDGYSRI
ncbi:hypothetical protein ACTQ5R_09720 [Ruoffia tabacinasalis]|uniref:hypothetical protein n=1 Tax=Ruoffia tabacinasalis TaxID=87458 RepID=UPI003F9A871B